MDVFANISVESFRILIGVLALTIGLLVFLSSIRDGTFEKIFAIVKALFAMALSVVALAVGVVFYILSHATDDRWSVGKDAAVESPQIPGNPFFGQVIDTLNSFMGSVTGSVNDLFAIKNAFITTQEFFLMAGWAILSVIPLFVLLRILNWQKEAREKRQIQRDRATLNRLSNELVQMKRVLGLPPPDVK
jgi:predicted membrane channel-forming protein YqfA (hemolysin III family)